jgi:hypothetical protein
VSIEPVPVDRVLALDRSNAGSSMAAGDSPLASAFKRLAEEMRQAESGLENPQEAGYLLKYLLPQGKAVRLALVTLLRAYGADPRGTNAE